MNPLGDPYTERFYEILTYCVAMLTFMGIWQLYVNRFGKIRLKLGFGTCFAILAALVIWISFLTYGFWTLVFDLVLNIGLAELLGLMIGFGTFILFGYQSYVKIAEGIKKSKAE